MSERERRRGSDTRREADREANREDNCVLFCCCCNNHSPDTSVASVISVDSLACATMHAMCVILIDPGNYVIEASSRSSSCWSPCSVFSFSFSFFLLAVVSVA